MAGRLEQIRLVTDRGRNVSEIPQPELTSLQNRIIDAWYSAQKVKGYSERKTIAHKSRYIHKSLNLLGEYIWNITAKQVDNLVRYLFSQNKKPNTILSYIRPLKEFHEFCFLRFAEEISSATGSPCRYVPIIDKFNCPRQQKGNSIRVPRSKEFFQKLFSFARERIHRARKPFVAARDFVILVLLYKTGARSIAVRHLTPADLHFHMGLYGTINARSDKGSNGSGFRSSMLDMSSTLRDVLKWYLDTFHCVYYSENDPLFPTESGCFMSENAFRMRILKIQKELKVQKAITPHDFRRAFASHHFEDGFPLDYIQRQCNHKYQTTTEGYIVTSHSYKVRQSGKVAALLFKEAEEKNYGKKNDPVPPMPARE